MPAVQLTSTDIIHMLKGFTKLQSKLLAAISFADWNSFLRYKYWQMEDLSLVLSRRNIGKENKMHIPQQLFYMSLCKRKQAMYNNNKALVVSYWSSWMVN